MCDAENQLHSAAACAHFSRVPSTNLTFSSRSAHREWLAAQSALPAGFRVGTSRFDFVPREAPKPAKMTLTLISLDRPTPDFAAVFTRNAFPGAPVIVGRRRLEEAALAAIIVNNKVSNVCAPGGVEASERISAAVAKALGFTPGQILPSSTGVIGWGLPVEAMVEAVPKVVPLPLDRGADTVQPQALERVSLKAIDDPRLAAVVLMIQLVRTNGLLTRAERDTILALMSDPLGIGDRERIYEQALQLTDRGRVFTPVAEELVPLFRARLSLPERQQLIDMLTEVANAYGEASDLQREAIVRLKRHLLAPDAAAGRSLN